MKTRFKKYASVFLCLVLILGVFMPMSNVGIVKAATTEKEAAIANLKAAWGKMYYSQETLLYPNIQKVAGNNTAADNIYATADGLAEGLLVGITAQDLGEYYAYHSKICSDTSTTGENRFMWFAVTSGNATYGSIDLSVYDDLKLSFYVEDVATPGDFNVQFITANSQPITGKKLSVSEDDEGNWKILNASDLTNSGMQALKTAFGENKLGFFQFNLGTNLTRFKGWFGSLVGIKNCVVPEYTNELDLIKKALAVNTTSLYNTADFDEALNEAKKVYAKELALDNLKTAWSEVVVSAESKLYPTAYRQKADKSDQIDNLWANNGIDASDEEKAFIGEKYVTLDIEDHAGRTTVSAYDNSYNLFIATTGTSLDASVNTLGNEVDGWLYIRINSVTAGGRLGFKWVKNGSTPAASGHYIDVSNVNVGEWIKVDLDDAIPGWKDDFVAGNNRFSRFEIQPVDGAKVNLSVGTVMFAYAHQVPALDGLELVMAADKFDISNCLNTEDFVAALNEAKKVYAKELALDNLKTAWGELISAESKLYPTAYRQKADKSDQIDNLWANNGIDASDEEKAFIGEKYVTLDIEDHAGRTTVSAYDNSYNLFIATTGTSLDASVNTLGNEVDGWLYIRINSVTAGGRLGFKWVKNGSTPAASGHYIDVSNVNVGEWIKVDLDDAIPGWKDDFVAGNNRFSRFEIQPVDGAKVNLSVGTVMFAYAPQVPEYDGIKLIDAAKEFDSTGYINAAAFEEALAVAEKEYSAELELFESNKAIKNAYGKMYTETVTGLYPNTEKRDGLSGALISGKADRFFDTENAELPFGANAEMLGDNYANYTGDYAISDNQENASPHSSDNRILFYAKENINYLENAFDISDYDGFYFNMYYKSVETDGALGFYIVAKDVGATINANVINITKESHEGKWVTYTDKDICEGGLETIKTKFDKNGLAALMVNLANKLDIEAYVGSLVFYKEVEPSEADTASDTFLGEMRSAELLNGLYNKEQFVNTIIDNTNNLAEKYADNKEVIEKIKFADDCNAYGGVDLKDLVRMARYNDNSEAVKIDKLAADGNEDKVINDLDEALLRAKLLQR